jgi:hypothetical protein
VLPIFPDFGPLLLDHKEDYDRLIAEYPPYSDISFATLQIWWNLEGKLELSRLNDNFVIHYLLPFDAQNSGYSLIGDRQVDESIRAIFEYQRQHDEPERLVHVPDFAVKEIEHPEAFKLEEELDYNEYILDSHALASLQDPAHGRTRRKVGRFLREVEDRKVELKQLDLSSQEAQDALFDAIVSWEHESASTNDPDNTEHHALKRTLAHASHLGIQHMGLYIDDKLYGIVLYHRPNDKHYFVMHHLKVDYSIPYIFDYMTHRIADKAVQEDVAFLNMEMDLGLERLRQHKMGLRPVEFFRKYTVTPASD